MAIANRIKEMREILDISVEDMADGMGLSPDDYLKYETGVEDFTFSFLYMAANRFGVDMTDLITGESPHLSVFSIVRKGEGLPIDRRKGFVYQNLAYQFKDRIAEPLLVVAKFDKEKASEEITLSKHAGQEFDFIISGSLRVKVGGNEEILNEGDSIYYNSGIKHGMVAIGGDCTFMAVVMNEKK